jgi:hypothetical protein
MKTAVAFIIFRRPRETQQVLARIREARPPALFVIADGPRPDRADDAGRCREARRVVEAGIDWPCEVVRIYADANLGCARRVSSGLDEVFRRVPEAIVLEDDCLPDPTFFPFCEELLARFRDDARIAQIAGCSYQDAARVPAAPSYHFSRYPHCWGWATWRRAWAHYDHGMKAWRDPAQRRRVVKAFPHPDERRYWRLNLRDTAAGKVDSWAYRWTFAVFRNDGLCVNPYRNLISNLGFGQEATHTGEASHPAAALPLSPMPFPLIHPAGDTRDTAADAFTGAMMFRRISLARRVRGKLARLWKKGLAKEERP